MKGLQYYYETCMSTGDIIGKVARPYYIEIDYQDINGNHLHRIAEDLIYNVNLEKRIEIRNKFSKKIISKEMNFNQDNISEKYKTKIYTKSY